MGKLDTHERKVFGGTRKLILFGCLHNFYGYHLELLLKLYVYTNTLCATKFNYCVKNIFTAKRFTCIEVASH